MWCSPLRGDGPAIGARGRWGEPAHALTDAQLVNRITSLSVKGVKAIAYICHSDMSDSLDLQPSRLVSGPRDPTRRGHDRDPSARSAPRGSRIGLVHGGRRQAPHGAVERVGARAPARIG